MAGKRAGGGGGGVALIMRSRACISFRRVSRSKPALRKRSRTRGGEVFVHFNKYTAVGCQALLRKFGQCAIKDQRVAVGNEEGECGFGAGHMGGEGGAFGFVI